MSEYDRAIATALRLITKKGQSVTLTTKTPGSYNPTTSGITVTESSEVAKGVVTNFATKDIDGDLIKVDDILLILASSGVIMKPQPDKTKVTLASGLVYTVKNVVDVAPSGVSIVYRLQLRK